LLFIYLLLIYVQVTAAWFSVFDVITLIIFLPLFDQVIYPWLERRWGRTVSVSRRILLGMVFATLSMVVAGVVEHFRLKTFWPNPPDSPHGCKNSSFNQQIGEWVV
jgi:dipeptide/tripeptide permease